MGVTESYAMEVFKKINRKNTFLKSQADANEDFVRSQCIGYMVPIIRQYAVWDSSTLDMISWLIGNQTGDLKAILASCLPNGPQKKILEIEGQKELVLEDSESMAFAVNHIPRHRFRHLGNQVVTLLEKELKKSDSGHKSGLAVNIKEFSNLFGLSNEEADLCLFLAIMMSWSQAEVYFDTHLNCDRYSGRKYLLAALNISTTRFEKVLHGRLRRLNFVHQDRTWVELSKDCLPLITESVQVVLSREHYQPLPAATVAVDTHVVKSDDLKHLQKLLAGTQSSATHVLFYGSPGTGKTSFTRALAASLECPSFEIMNNAENKVQNRRLGITACLNLTNHGQGSLVVIDEADSLLNTDDGWFMRGESQDKGWLNVLLEEPGTRVIWITNRVDNIDPSVLRRFAYSLHFPKFGRLQREQLWESILRKHRVKSHFNTEDIRQLASQYEVSAGAINVAVDKARESGFDSKGDLLANVHRSLAAHLTLQRGGKPMRKKDSREQQYVLDVLNLTCEPTELESQVKRFDKWWKMPVDERPLRSLNLLFHGPSGTGKTELARHLAYEMDRPLLVRRTSDLLGKYVGETERSIARAFDQAEAEGAVLLIDEADSLLFPRGKASRSWEVSFTNEFLTQMERFRGMLVCTTNRVDDLDDASLRRFGRKIGFGYLETEGIWELYDVMLAPLVGRRMSGGMRQVVGSLEYLTPGVFRVVRDEMVMSGDGRGHEGVVEALRVEAGYLGSREEKMIGFG